MAKKKKIQETTIENYYDLKIDKVDELVAALKDDGAVNEDISFDIYECTGVDAPENVNRNGKQKQFDPYKTDFLGRVPAWLKALLVKWWFAGMVCFFFVWGLGISDSLDLMVLVGAVLGIVVDALVNPLFRYMETDKDHIHYMIETEPAISVSKIVNLMKSYTTYHIWERYPDYLRKHFWKERTFWTDGYFACSVGNVSEEMLWRYIENQG